jgi:Trypsin-like peptidase domain/MAP3K TRAFs-binding domain
MAWDDLGDLERRLQLALQRFDWEAADEVCRNIIDRLPGETSSFPAHTARALLQALRRKCRFAAMALLAEAFLESGLRTAQIRRQYGQALIDQGMLSGAEPYLRELIQDPETSVTEQAEAHGLMARIYKQRYVNEAGKASPERALRNLQRSFDEYQSCYNADPKANTWHGINMVALLARAERDQIALKGTTDYRALARTILAALDQKEEEATEGLYAWDLATQMEAYVALGQFDRATRTANQYVAAIGADAFEISSTLRQLIEVWQVNNEDPPGYNLLPILCAAKLSKEGGGLTMPVQEARQDLEKVFGSDGSQSLKWYQEGLSRAKSVCRIEMADGKGIGTGWLVRSTDFFPNQPPRSLVLTNAHVVSTTYASAIKPPGAWANFQMIEKRVQLKSIVWSSPVEELDATFLDFAEDLVCEPMPLWPSPMEIADPAPRMFIIGHPGGRDLEFSLNDNRLVACNSQKLHYRTPTEGGSSGSPVFDPLGWEVVGLHHAGRSKMPKLNGPAGEFYEANEGIAILAIQQKTRSLL